MVNDDLKIFVGIPLFNTLPYIEKCIDSILAQEYQEIRILVVDDGSTDGSFDFLVSHYSSNPRITILKNDVNRGIGYTRNRIIQMAKGDLFLWVDSDDYLLPGAIMRAVQAVKMFPQEQAVAVIQNILLVSEGQKNTKTTLYPKTKIQVLSSNEAVSMAMVDRQIRAFSWSAFFPVSAVKNIHFPDNSKMYIDDLLVAYQYYQNCSKVVKIPDPGYVYNMRPGTDSHTPDFYKRLGATLTELEKTATKSYTDILPILLAKQAIFEAIFLVGLYYPKEKWAITKKRLRSASDKTRKTPLGFRAAISAGKKTVLQRFCLIYFPLFFAKFYLKKQKKRFR